MFTTGITFGNFINARLIIDADPEPKFKYRFSEAMRLAIYHAYRIEDEMTDLIIEKQCVLLIELRDSR